MRREWAFLIGLVLAAPAVSVAADDEAAPEKDTRRHVQVLQDPHDISSFYTSSQRSPFDVDYGYDEYDNTNASDPYSISSFYTQDAPDGRYPIASFYRQDAPEGRYPIASFYRQNSPTGRYPIAGFYRQGATGRYSRFWQSSQHRRAFVPMSVRRRVRTSDLCFAAPTVLVPFAPFVTDGR